MSRMNQNIENLRHTELALPQGGKVVVLDPGATLTAEMTAMLQALHSRSIGGINDHLRVLAERGAAKFMSSYYVGYGHKSIGDCGTAIVFVEGISMLAAKALQDSPLYNGQESSTRYIDYAAQPLLNPLGTAAGKDVLERWRTFYLQAVSEMKATLPTRHPRQPEEKETVYDKAITARAFDICRGFLPAGAATNVAWSTTLRQFADRILQLRHHPLAEVRDIATVLEGALLAAYPNSFNQEKKRYDKTEAYLAEAAKHYYFHDPNITAAKLVRDGVDHEGLAAYRGLLLSLPQKTELPKWLGAYGEVGLAFPLDFGSFRDLQRHRALNQRMPLLTAELGFADWYLEELTPELRTAALALLTEQKERVANLATTPEIAQYYQPMGYRVSNLLSGDLPALVYMLELRSASTVHPTLVKVVQELGQLLIEQYADLGLTLHLATDGGRFDVKRGLQDIVLQT